MKAPKINFKSFIFELVIVFVGVYGAFELNRYQEHQREQKLKVNYFNSFQSELVKLSSDIHTNQRVIDRKLHELDSAWAAGGQPELTPLKIYFGAQMLITKAGFNDDVFTQMSANLSASLSGGYDHVQAVSQQAREFNQTCRMHLISNRPIEFYDRQGKLKPQFNWYVEDLRTLKFYFDRLDQMITQGALPATREVLKELN